MTKSARAILSHSIVLAVALALGLWIYPSASATEEENRSSYTARVIAGLNAILKEIQTYSVDTLEVTYSDGRFTIQEGRMWVDQNERWRWAGTTHAGKIVSDFLIVSDGTSIWSKDDLANTVLKAAVDRPRADPEPSNLRPFISQHPGISWEALGITELRTGQSVYEIEGKVSGFSQTDKATLGAGTALVRAWVGTADGLLYKVTEYDQAGSETSTTIFTNHQPNISIDPELFRFEIPHGVQVVDLSTPHAKNEPLKIPVKMKGRKPVRQ